MRETLEHYIYRLHSRESADTYMYYINIFLQRNPNARRYQYQDVVNYLSAEKENKCSQSILASMLTRIKKYYDYLVEVGIRNDHPCKKISTTTLYNKQVQLQDLFTGNELETLLKNDHYQSDYKFRNQVAMSLLIYQGLTTKEIVALDVEDIDFENETLLIQTEGKKKERLLPLHPKQILLLERYLTNTRPKLLKGNTNKKLLISHRGVPMTKDSIWILTTNFKMLYPDRNINPTTIRMSVIANLLNEKKWAIEDVQLFVGHSLPSTTEKYLREDIEEKRELINKYHPLR